MLAGTVSQGFDLAVIGIRAAIKSDFFDFLLGRLLGNQSPQRFGAFKSCLFLDLAIGSADDSLAGLVINNLRR